MLVGGSSGGGVFMDSDADVEAMASGGVLLITVGEGLSPTEVVLQTQPERILIDNKTMVKKKLES